MEDWFNKQTEIFIYKNRYTQLTYVSIANRLNRHNMPCYFSPDTLWTPIHVKNWTNGDYSFFDAEKYEKGLLALIYYMLYIQGKSKETILSILGKEGKVSPSTGLLVTQRELAEYILTIERGCPVSRKIDKKIPYLQQLKNIYGQQKRYATPLFLRPIENNHEEVGPSA